jgi:endoglucanase
VPRDAVVVAVECSKAIAGVNLGDGPVLRVGDKASVFTPAATAYCQVVAERLAAKDKSFKYQRKLMDGGTCESTAYCHHGYDATGICLPLGNYHNMDTERRKIAPEFVDVRDFQWLVQWFIALADSPAEVAFDGRHPGLDARLDTLLKKHRPHLLRTAGRVAAE